MKDSELRRTVPLRRRTMEDADDGCCISCYQIWDPRKAEWKDSKGNEFSYLKAGSRLRSTWSRVFAAIPCIKVRQIGKNLACCVNTVHSAQVTALAIVDIPTWNWVTCAETVLYCTMMLVKNDSFDAEPY